MKFIYYDLIFLLVFSILGVIFLYKRRKNLKREMKIFHLYRTQVGVRFIERVSDNHKKLLGVFKYIIIIVSYLLMGFIVVIFGQSVYGYLRYPLFTEIISAPPVFPVVPYFPEIFGVESLFPPFYFTYFLVAFIIVATFHEFAHAIYARLYKIRIKSTGVVFLGPLLAGAFVEQDDKQMEKAKKCDQLAILGAGVFANLILAIIFFLLLWGVFSINFTPGGALFNSYSTSSINISNIEQIDGKAVSNLDSQKLAEIVNNGVSTDLNVYQTLSFKERLSGWWKGKDISLSGFIKAITTNDKEVPLSKLYANNQSYYFSTEDVKKIAGKDVKQIVVFDDMPAINAGIRLNSAITEVDGKKIETYEDLTKIMPTYSTGEEISVKAKHNGKVSSYKIILAEDPNQKGRAIMGIGNNIFGAINIEKRFAFFKEEFTAYESKSNFLYYLYYLFFWVFLLNAAVALFNMLPLLIFDGGRFFYLTVWGITTGLDFTKDDRAAKWAYKWMGIAILASLILLLVIWLFRVV